MLVTHTSASTQARCRSDLRKGCVKQRLPAQVRMYQITLLFPLYLSAQHLFCLLPSSSSFILSPISPIVSRCLLDMPRFQSWWVTRELPRCLQVSSSLTEPRKGHDGTERMKENAKINRCMQGSGQKWTGVGRPARRGADESLDRDAWRGLSSDLSWGRGWRLSGLLDKLHHFVSWTEPALCLCAGGSNCTVICSKPGERLSIGYDRKVQLLFTANRQEFVSHRLC